jgi:hypothetical protein
MDMHTHTRTHNTHARYAHDGLRGRRAHARTERPHLVCRPQASIRFYVVNLLFLSGLWAQFLTGVGMERDVKLRLSSSLSLSAVAVAWRACTTLIIFGVRNLVMRVAYPDCLVILKSRIETRTSAAGHLELVTHPPARCAADRDTDGHVDAHAVSATLGEPHGPPAESDDLAPAPRRPPPPSQRMTAPV